MEKFAEKSEHLANEKGFYIFDRAAGRGIIPHYIGISRGALKKEIFAHHKIPMLQKILSRHGTTKVFFLVPENVDADFNRFIRKEEELSIGMPL